MAKTFNDFKQEVAEKYGFDRWYKLLDSVEWEQVPDLSDEAAELYAEYRAKEGWNEALKWASENSKIIEFLNISKGGVTYEVDKESIIKGLK